MENNEKKDDLLILYNAATIIAIMMITFKPIGIAKRKELTFSSCINKAIEIYCTNSENKKNVNKSIVTDIANEIYWLSDRIAKHYTKIAKNRLLAINKRQPKHKYISQSARIFKAVLTAINRDDAESENLINSLAQMHYFLKVKRVNDNVDIEILKQYQPSV